MNAVGLNDIRATVKRIVDETPVVDMHTHIYPPSFGSLLLWGIDELIDYHYLIAEAMRVAPVTCDEFWNLTKPQQADLIWNHLFIQRSPISESCRGVLTCMKKLGLDASRRDLEDARAYFRDQDVETYVEKVFETANVRYAVMTNDPFDPTERGVWLKGGTNHPRFKAALRVDPLLMDWEKAVPLLAEQGYIVSERCNEADLAVVRRFLDDWADRMNPLYLAVSLTPFFQYPDTTPRTCVIESCILPLARERGIPFAMMIGVKKLINPDLRLAGDGVGKSDICSVENLCVRYPENRFLVTMLSRENQHELCVTARKFSNLLPFGCWWFMNNPSIIDEITRERFELLGFSFVPQHSDARVLDQLLYKWDHSRKLIGNALADQYEKTVQTGWAVTEDDIQRDVNKLFSVNFESFVGLQS